LGFHELYVTNFHELINAKCVNVHQTIRNYT